jgi:hypothetical protein
MLRAQEYLSSTMDHFITAIFLTIKPNQPKDNFILRTSAITAGLRIMPFMGLERRKERIINLKASTAMGQE